MNNGIIHIVKTGLEEMVEYHKAGFGIIDGYYYNQGRNNTINHVVKDLYDLRSQNKKRTLHRWILNC